MGLDPSTEEARRAVALVGDNVTWQGVLPQDAAWHGRYFFAGEVEPCNQRPGGHRRRVLRPGRAGHRGPAADEQIAVLLEHERGTGANPALTAARERGHECLLERRMLRRRSTGELIDPAFTEISYPTGYHYDVLRGLDYPRSADVAPDERVAEAIALVESTRDADGRWPLQNRHPDQLDFNMDEAEGWPSRWNTLRAPARAALAPKRDPDGVTRGGCSKHRLIRGPRPSGKSPPKDATERRYSSSAPGPAPG